MKLIKHHDEIWELENFLYEDEIDTSFKFIRNTSDDQWVNNRNWKIPDFSELKMLTEHIKRRMLCYVENVELEIGIHDIQRLVPGAFLDRHQDIDTSEKGFNIVYGAVAYLNDNFEGGEIYYPDLDYKIKPKRGSLILHKAEYLHEVLPVKSGIRYMVTIFIVGDKNTRCLLK